MADRPRLAVIDDPLAVGKPADSRPPAAPTPETRVDQTPTVGDTTTPMTAQEDTAREDGPRTKSKAKRPPRRTTQQIPTPVLGDEPQKALFARVPRSLDRQLEAAVFELRAEDRRITRQDILAALVCRHVRPGDNAALAELAEMVEAYREALERPPQG